MLFALGKGDELFTVTLVFLLPFVALLVSGCAASGGDAGDLSDSEETDTADTIVSWSYTALGDSLAAGTGASYQGYVNRYAGYLESDTGIRVNVTNLGRNGQTSSELLLSLRKDTSSRQAVREADVLTVNIGINDLGQAAQSYKDGTCGGADNQDCLHTAAKTVKGNWSAIIAELLSLRSTNDTIIRAVGLGYTPYLDPEEAPDVGPRDGELSDFRVFKPYLDEVNHHIATTTSDNGIPYAEVRLDKGYISQDGVHPSDEGYEVIVGQLRELWYSLLR